MNTFFKIGILILFMTFKVQSQTNLKKFFKDVLNDKSKEILYTDKLSDEDIQQITRSLESLDIEIIDSTSRDKVILTKEEIEFAVKEIKLNNSKSIESNLIVSSKKISATVLNNIFSDEKKDWEYFHKNFGEEYHTFSFPIFIRENSVCLLYQAVNCGPRCGNGGLTIYKKENGIWKLYASFHGWIS